MNDDLSLNIQCQLSKEQLSRIKSIAPNIFDDNHHTEFIFYPDTDSTGHETIIRLLKYGHFSCQLRNNLNLLLKQIITIKFNEKPRGETNITFAFPEKTIQPNKEQGQVFQAMRDKTYPVIFQQAPASTGKTLIATVAIWQWYHSTKRQTDIIVVTATTNYAIQNAAKSFFKLVEDLPKGTVIFLQSVAAKLRPVTVSGQIWCDCRVPELLRDLLDRLKDVIEKTERKEIEKYRAKRLEHNGEAFKKTLHLKDCIFITSRR